MSELTGQLMWDEHMPKLLEVFGKVEGISATRASFGDERWLLILTITNRLSAWYSFSAIQKAVNRADKSGLTVTLRFTEEPLVFHLFGPGEDREELEYFAEILHGCIVSATSAL